MNFPCCFLIGIFLFFLSSENGKNLESYTVCQQPVSFNVGKNEANDCNLETFDSHMHKIN